MKDNQEINSSVRFEQVTKIFGKSTVAVDNLSTTMDSGKLVTLLGPSGCGKTTVLRMIAGLEMPSSGKIFLGESDITKLPASDRDISMVFQSYALFPHMDVLKNVSYGLKFSGFSSSEITEQAHNGLKLVGLEHLAKRLPNQLSGGQQQRVAVARAIVLKPRVLLFDEPLSNLDAKLRRSVREEIREIQQKLNLTVIYVTHDQEEALAVSDHIIVMNNAKLAQQGPPQAIFQEPVSEFVADFIGESNILNCEVIKIKKPTSEVNIGKKKFLVTTAAYDSQPGPAKVAIRPPHIQIVKAKGKTSPSKMNFASARVVKATYLGVRMEYVLESDLGLLFAVSQDLFNPFNTGEQVQIYINPKQLILLPTTV